MDKDELLELKERIDKAKTKVSQLEGRKETLLQQLQDDWECDTVEEAEEKLEELESEAEALEEKIQEGIKHLKEKYDVS